MKRNLLAAVTANISSISEREFDAFLVKHHGAVSRENASSDPSALDSVGNASLKAKQREPRTYVLKGIKAQRGQALFKVEKGTKETKRITIKSVSSKKKKVTF